MHVPGFLKLRRSQTGVLLPSCVCGSSKLFVRSLAPDALRDGIAFLTHVIRQSLCQNISVPGSFLDDEFGFLVTPYASAVGGTPLERLRNRCIYGYAPRYEVALVIADESYGA
jgi:hypothetical protein